MAKFETGKSGNPKGRPIGTGRTAQLRALLDPHATSLMQKAVDMALDGDTTALRLCLERLCPPVKAMDEPVNFPDMKGTLTEQGQKIFQGIGAGELSPEQGRRVMQSLTAQVRITEVDELEKRVSELEKNNGNTKPFRAA